MNQTRAKATVISKLANFPSGPGKRMLVQLRELEGHRFLAAFVLKQRDGAWQAGPFFTLNRHSFQPFLNCLRGSEEIIVLALNAKSVEELEQEVRGEQTSVRPAPRTRTATPKASSNQLELDFGSVNESAPETHNKEA